MRIEHNIQRIIIENSESIKASKDPIELIKHLLLPFKDRIAIANNELIDGKYVLSVNSPIIGLINIFITK